MFKLKTTIFTVPSGKTFEVREQNGEDEDILSRPQDLQDLMYLSKFISAIVVHTDATESGKLSVKEALDLPLLDRYCILIKARIFSIGPDLDFTYTWPNMKEPCNYSEDLTQYVFDDYSKVTEEEIIAKPNAIPLYSDPENLKGRVVTLSSGKVISFDCATGTSEAAIFALPEEERSNNKNYIYRNLKLEVDGKMEKVTNFSMFNPKDMAEIRKIMISQDPTWLGVTDIPHPNGRDNIQLPILAIPSFFFPMEM